MEGNGSCLSGLNLYSRRNVSQQASKVTAMYSIMTKDGVNTLLLSRSSYIICLLP